MLSFQKCHFSVHILFSPTFPDGFPTKSLNSLQTPYSITSKSLDFPTKSLRLLTNSLHVLTKSVCFPRNSLHFPTNSLPFPLKTGATPIRGLLSGAQEAKLPNSTEKIGCFKGKARTKKRKGYPPHLKSSSEFPMKFLLRS